LTDAQYSWLQKNVIKSRKLNLKFRNEGHMKFREAGTSRAGTFYLAKGQNGAIYGALTFVKIQNYPGSGWNFVPGETMIFSVTNQKIFNYVGTTGQPIFTNFMQYFSNIGFTDGSWDFSLLFRTDDNTRLCESYSGGRNGF